MFKYLRWFFLTFCSFSPLVYSTEYIPQIYDCFLFFNELELLQVRLDELYDSVDKFVLVESYETFKGNPKPLYFQENQHLFEKYKDKIIYVCVENFETSNPWEREHFQRNQIMRGLKNCEDNDIIIISDLDEIMSANSIRMIKEGKINPFCLAWELRLFPFFLNVEHEGGLIGSFSTTLDHLKTSSIYDVRLRQNSFQLIHNGGWHFTSLGGLDRIITKLKAFSHAEFDHFTINDSLKQILAAFSTVASTKYRLVEIDETYPRFILNNLSFFKEKGFILAPSEAQEIIP